MLGCYKLNTSRRNVNALINLNILSFLLFIVFSLNCCAGSTLTHVYAYESSDTYLLVEYLQKCGCEVVFHSLNESSSATSAEKIVKTLILMGGVEFNSSINANLSRCIKCETPLYLYARSLMLKYASPMIIFLYNGKLTAITLGINDPEYLNRILNEIRISSGCIKVFTSNTEYCVSDALFANQIGPEAANLKIILLLISLAIADSVNPCTFLVFTALLLITLHTMGKTRMFYIGLIFIVAVFLSYCSLGLGLMQILATIPYIDVSVALIGLFVGIFNINQGLKGKNNSYIPKLLRIFINKQIGKLCCPKTSFVLSFALGIIIGFAVLPCSAGPYMISITLLSDLESPLKYFLLVLYNIIFISPLIVILFILLFLQASERKIKRFRSMKVNLMELIGGIILILVCILILFNFLVRMS